MPPPPVPDRSLDWRTLLLLGGMYALLVGNFALYQTAPLPVVVHVLAATLGIHLAFTIWHEGVHKNVSQRGWVNDLVGVLGIFPYMTPYFLQRWIHLQHHKHLNEVDDPNHIYTDGPFWTIGFRYPRIILYLNERVGDDPRTPAQRRADLAAVAAVLGVYAVAWWNGVLVDLLLLWLLPVVLAKVVMDWYINYLPHVGLPPHRFQGTRVIDLPAFTPFVLAHNYHAVHHLWPGIAWHRYPAVFREQRDFLKARGVPIERRLVGFRAEAVESASSA